MNAPPGNNPDRALYLATRSTQLLGIVSGAFGLIMIVAFGYFNRYPRFGPYFIAMGLIVWFAPGVTFVASAYFLKQRKRVGVILGLTVAVLQSFCAAAIGVAVCTLPPVSPIPIVMSVLWWLALGQLILHLQRAQRAIHLDTITRPGFAVDAPLHVLPVNPQPTEQ